MRNKNSKRVVYASMEAQNGRPFLCMREWTNIDTEGGLNMEEFTVRTKLKAGHLIRGDFRSLTHSVKPT